MKFSTLSTWIITSIFVNTALSQLIGTPHLTYLSTINLTLAAPVPVGPGPIGDRNFFPCTGGFYSGAFINGTVLPYGGDWGLGDPQAGNLYLDARHIVRTHDGADVYVQANGPQRPESEGVLHVRVTFETGHPDYYWLNRVVSVGLIEPGPNVEYIIVDLWALESPPRPSLGRG